MLDMDGVLVAVVEAHPAARTPWRNDHNPLSLHNPHKPLA
jgi:hypothetical protein